MTPPETVPTAVVDLVRWRPEWAPSLASAVEASLAELAPYMPWATPTYGLADARTYIDGSIADWDAGTNWNYAIVTRAGEVVGSTGLMTRLGPGVLEIGYWLHTGHVGRGYATAVAQTLATVGLAQPGIETVVIRHDAANVASGRVAEKAGFIRIGSVDVADGSGVEVRWERRAAARVPMIAWETHFAKLFEPWQVSYAPISAQFGTTRPVDALISRVHVVARANGGVVVCRSDDGWRFLPGGTREPGETMEQIVDRELAEEAGARRTGPLTWIGAHRAENRGAVPYRPHLPHPLAFWAYVATDVAIEHPPTNPADGEEVVEVAVLPVAEAVAFLAPEDPIHADVLRLAAEMGLA